MGNDEKVLVIGDVHGKTGGYFDLLEDFVTRYSRTENTYTLQLGDMGFTDTYQQIENRFERSDKLDSENHFFLGGNHDDYSEYGQMENALGDFGEVPFVPGGFFVRGAKSLDKEARTMGADWWPQEELDWKQTKEAIDQYIKTEPRIVFSHDVPQNVADKMFPSKPNYVTNTGRLLQTMFGEHKPEKWFFGHWHRNKTYETPKTTFHCLKELGTKEIDNYA